jgi:hypothetical protein
VLSLLGFYDVKLNDSEPKTQQSEAR